MLCNFIFKKSSQSAIMISLMGFSLIASTKLWAQTESSNITSTNSTSSKVDLSSPLSRNHLSPTQRCWLIFQKETQISATQGILPQLPNVKGGFWQVKVKESPREDGTYHLQDLPGLTQVELKIPFKNPLLKKWTAKILRLIYRPMSISKVEQASKRLVTLLSDVTDKRHFWVKTAQALGRKTDPIPELVQKIKFGEPTILVMNHSTGFDPAEVFATAAQINPNTLLIATDLLAPVPEMSENTALLPLSKSAKAMAMREQIMLEAEKVLKLGGIIIICPFGTISQKAHPFVKDVPEDEFWRPGFVRLMRAEPHAVVIPTLVDGHASFAYHAMRWFGRKMQKFPAVVDALEIASNVKQIGTTIDNPMPVYFGEPLVAGKLLNAFGANSEELTPARNDADLKIAEFLRQATYSILDSTKQVDVKPYLRPTGRPVVAEELPLMPSGEEILAELQSEANEVVQTTRFSVFIARVMNIPKTMFGIGVSRERTFREPPIYEGTNTRLDLDRFDPWYYHLIAMGKAKKTEIAGAYRAGWIKELWTEHGQNGIYTAQFFPSKLYQTKFINYLDLTRSYVIPEHQARSPVLAYLFKAIGSLVMDLPDVEGVLGPMSISGALKPKTQELILEYLLLHHSDEMPPDSMGMTNRPVFQEELSPDDVEFVKSLDGKEGPDVKRDIERLTEYAQRHFGETSIVNPLLGIYISLGTRFIRQKDLKTNRSYIVANRDLDFNTLDVFTYNHLSALSVKKLEPYMSEEGAIKFLSERGTKH